jgi:hypothetical protein
MAIQLQKSNSGSKQLNPFLSQELEGEIQSSPIERLQCYHDNVVVLDVFREKMLPSREGCKD